MNLITLRPGLIAKLALALITFWIAVGILVAVLAPFSWPTMPFSWFLAAASAAAAITVFYVSWSRVAITNNSIELRTIERGIPVVKKFLFRCIKQIDVQYTPVPVLRPLNRPIIVISGNLNRQSVINLSFYTDDQLTVLARSLPDRLVESGLSER